jgi:GTPase Era involved in 16S rRNA processing
MTETPWNAIRGKYLSKLEQNQQLIFKIKEIIALEGMKSPTIYEQRTEAEQLSIAIQRQIQKLRDDEFHVAVVGLEKSGKSTFLNAWLKSDLLPNQTTRCTFTTTEIRSATSVENQYLHIEYLSTREFEDLCSEYEQKAAGSGSEAKNARSDLEEMKRDLPYLRTFIGRGSEKYSFSSLEEIAAPLREAVANPKQARAVKRALIHTQSLSGRVGLVFHDVPGYDSPTKLHKDLSRAELSRADVIICVTNISANVSINESLLAMLDVVDHEDKEIKAYQKMFVFLNQADRTNELEFKDRYEKSVHIWHNELNKCIPERIIAGSAGVYMGKHVANFFHDSGNMLRATSFTFKPEHGDGIEHLKDKVDHYLEHERAGVVSKRCETLINKTRILAQKTIELLSPLYPGDIKDIDLNASVQGEIHFSEWFDDLWKKYERELSRFWSEQIMPNNGDIDRIASKNPTLKGIQDAYNACIDNIDGTLFSEENLKDEYQRNIQGNVPQPTKTNIEERNRLRRRALGDGVKQIIGALLDAQLQVNDQIVGWVTERFFGIEAIRTLTNPLTNEQAYKEQLRYGFETLFTRFARPATDAILRAPRETPERRRAIRELHARDIELLELYYDAPNNSCANLRKYLLEGRWRDPVVEQIAGTIQEIGSALPISPVKKSVFDVLKATTQTTLKPAETFEELKQELSEDCDALTHYLKHSVYYAASFEDFCEQELLALKEHLLHDDMRRKVRRMLITASHHKHPALVAELGAQEVDQKHMREMIGKLSELRTLVSNN